MTVTSTGATAPVSHQADRLSDQTAVCLSVRLKVPTMRLLLSTKMHSAAKLADTGHIQVEVAA